MTQPPRTVTRRPLASSLLLTATLAQGCLPYVTPPIRVSISAAGQTEPDPWLDEDESSAPPSSTAVGPEAQEPQKVGSSIRLGIVPLSFVHSMRFRRFDSTAGLLIESFADRTTAIGGYLDGTYFPVRHVVGENSSLFVGIQPSLDIFAAPVFGAGGTMTLSAGLSQFVTTPFASTNSDSSDGVTAGVAVGEFTIAAVAGVGYRSFGEYADNPAQHQAVFSGGLQFSIPLLAGIYCCILPGDVSD